MAKKQKNEEVELRPPETPQPRQLSNEEKELVNAAIKIAIAKRRRSAIMVTLVTLVKHVQLMLPFNIDTKTLMEYVKAELVKDYKLITLQDRIGNDELRIEAILLYNNIEQLIEEFKQRKIDTIIKVVDASLDTVEDYK
jgi:hypothetical protein